MRQRERNVHCETPKPIACENNYPPIKVYDESGCCFHYECQCICYGWGDPHYVTFDGTYYGFQGNCSYVLVKEILPKYNFSVVIDNYYCDAPDAPDGLSCPQSLTIYYQSYEIFMTKKDVDGVFTSLIYVNQQRIIPAYETKDFRITDNGIETLLVIPAINAKVSFTGLMFSIYLPWDKFSGNTEGQCGTCDNNRTDDCRLPNGTIDSSCPDMAHQWHVADHNNMWMRKPIYISLSVILLNVTLTASRAMIIKPFLGSVVGSVYRQAPGSVWIPSGDKCLKYECVKIMDQLIPIEAKTVCPDFYPEDCVPGTEVIAPDGCCRVCIPITKPCNVTKSKVYVDSNGCKSANKVEVTTCGGSCVTYVMYSLEANMMERSCTCCREESTTKKEVEMICPDGSKFNHSYIDINKCGCQRTECVTPEATQVTRSRRRRR
ncbi:intestinal mucin-like protein [Salvelinus namaycush]|uniref:Intestinal mucin-like protein n=1 Tax=Salvelinus namaycush TaxID=8040 RepID=A0A8U0PH77_SALNM|nr:intestinal mucin-like protein [Salvelinus namaycush]